MNLCIWTRGERIFKCCTTMTNRDGRGLAFASVQNLRGTKNVNRITDFPLLPQAPVWFHSSYWSHLSVKFIMDFFFFFASLVLSFKNITLKQYSPWLLSFLASLTFCILLIFAPALGPRPREGCQQGFSVTSELSQGHCLTWRGDLHSAVPSSSRSMSIYPAAFPFFTAPLLPHFDCSIIFSAGSQIVKMA